MTQQKPPTVVLPGTVVEFFESREILVGVCLAVKNQRLTVLSENRRELNLARGRVLHFGSHPLDSTLSRDEMILELQKIKEKRFDLAQKIDIVELWSLLQDEASGFDSETLAELIFSEQINDHHIAGLQRVLLQDRLYFQFKDGKFHARSEDKVRQREEQLRQEAQKEALLAKGADWLTSIWKKKQPARGQSKSDDADDLRNGYRQRITESLKSFALFGQESNDQSFVKELLKRANLPSHQSSAFRLLVKMGVWREDENIYLHQQGIPVEFPQEVSRLADDYINTYNNKVEAIALEQGHEDLRSLDTFTIDSAMTRDYDDALSLKRLSNGRYQVGVHIADVAAVIEAGDPIDHEARCRASSVYLPDRRIPMIPPSLSEDLCSLLRDEDRLALSFLFEIDTEAVIHDTVITPSLIRVHQRMTYDEYDRAIEASDDLGILHQISIKLREERLERGATILPLPEVNAYVNSLGMIHIHRHLKETPSQLVVSEWMIAANGLCANYLATHGIPAIFRSQGECKPETNPVMSDHPLFHIYRQKRLFARAELDTQPERHCSLGMESYTSVTSPIRRFIDLVTQRQLKHAIKHGEALYSEDELNKTITEYRSYFAKIGYVQRKWSRYWLLKYIEQEDIQALNALVLEKNNRFAHLLLPDFLMEINMPAPEELSIQPGEMIRVRVDKVHPREDVLRVKPAARITMTQ